MSEKRKLVLISLLLVGSLGIAVLFLPTEELTAPGAETSDTASKNSTSSQGLEDEKTASKLRTFSAADFKQAYDELSLPNIKPIIIAPPITGNEAADTRIQYLAEQRGYRLRDVASGLLNELNGEQVQELLISNWQNLEAAAKEDGIAIQFISGYRSVEEQTALFKQRLYSTGVTNSEIASGQADSIVEGILRVTAPPGYSRHHSGYTIDAADPGYSVFAQSSAYEWISANNFENAKKYGFIPSYPDSLNNQGPDPEPWEFVWVSKEVTYQ